MKRYEDPALLEQYIRSQYGSFVLENPYTKSEGFYQSLIAEAASYLHANTLACDIGCSVGRLSFEWAKIAKQTTGIDSSGQFIAFCESMRQQEAVRFICADALTYAFVAESFDFISCINVIDRVGNPQLLVDIMGNVLVQGGTVMLVDPYDWALSPTPKKMRISDIKHLLTEETWNVKKETWLDYTVPISHTKDREYRCHLVIAEKR